MQEQSSHPVWHLVSVDQPVVVVEDHDGGDHAGRHHEHDAVEVGPDERSVVGHGQHLPHNCREEHNSQQQVNTYTTIII